MSLIVEPDDGIGPVVSAIQKAKTSVDIGIFRLDRGDIARALRTAVARGVSVRTLIAYTNRGGSWAGTFSSSIPRPASSWTSCTAAAADLAVR